jgi:serine/threonine protein kinase/tetratricopeptide (TPR) repeat protein
MSELIDLPLGDREAFLERTCRGDTAKRQRLVGRLEELTELLLSAPPTGSATLAPSSRDDLAHALCLGLHVLEKAGTTVGRYVLREKIGEGGCGTVYRAEQEQPLRREVALKLIKLGLDTREFIARFDAERHALALMEHPNIARVFDAGATETGRPYFVMELVRGVPITRYCDEHRLTTQDRLRLFIPVCQAVQHAHQKGILHRDLKPSNILVTLHDGVPVPKIIDFGISKAMHGRLAERSLDTAVAQFVGTPAYMSPEQLAMSSLDVDTRSDIYSLGVLLYELLSGKPPFDPDALKKSGLEEMRRIIREVDPPSPSQLIVSLTAERRDRIARQRNVDADRLALHLRGDLDWIVLRCLEKDRTRRYATAHDLAADVQRHLQDEPVLARSPSSAYRLRKFIRRHKLWFVAGSALALAVVTGLVAITMSLVRERDARSREAALRREADTNARTSAQVARFMNDMLGGVAPNVALGRDASLLREIADLTAQRLETELQDEPAVGAALRDTLGNVYIGLGQNPTAEKLLREAAAMHRAVRGEESAEVANSRHLLGEALRHLNRVAEAETELRAALEIRRKRVGENHSLFADTLEQLAHNRVPDRTTADRRAMLEQVLANRRQTYRGEHPSIASAIFGLGLVAQDDYDHPNGVRLHAEALAMRRKLLPNDHPLIAASLERLGYSYAHELGRNSEAAAAYRESFALRRRVLGDGHPNVLVPFLGLTGQLTAQAATPADLALVREFVASQRKVLSPRDAVLLAPSLLALASLEGDTDPSRERVREARALLETSRAQSALLFTAEIIDEMAFFGWSKFIRDLPAEGLLMAEEGLKLAHVVFGRHEPRTMLPSHILAWVYFALGRHDAAGRQFEYTLRLLPPGEVFTLLDQAALAACYRATGRAGDARQLLEGVLATHREAHGDLSAGHPRIAMVMTELGLMLVQEKQFLRAEQLLRQALVRYESPEIRVLGRRLRPSERALSGLGLALAGQGRFDEAEPFVIRAFEELNANEKRVLCDRAEIVREAFEAVVTLYDAWGKPERAAAWRAKRGIVEDAR